MIRPILMKLQKGFLGSVLLGLALTTLTACATQRAAQQDRPMRVVVPGALTQESDQHHPMPSQCASGCDVLPPALLVSLDDEALAANLAAYARVPVDEASEALDTLLFYAGDTRFYLSQHPQLALSQAHRNFLQRQLQKSEAEIELRITDDKGVVRAFIPQMHVPFGQKQHLRLQHRNLPGLVASGTVLRVGRDRLWTRI